MLIWLNDNLGTIIISLILAALIGFIIYRMIRDRRQGISSCGGNCAHCGMCAGHRNDRTKGNR